MKPNTQILSHHRPPPAPSRSVAVLLISSHGRGPCLPIGLPASLQQVRRAHKFYLWSRIRPSYPPPNQAME